MDIFYFTIATWFLYIVIKYLNKKHQKLNLSEKYLYKNILKGSIFSYLNKFLFIAAITYTFLSSTYILMIITPNFVGFNETLKSIFGSLSGISDFLKIFKNIWIWIIWGIILLASLIIRHKVMKANIKTIISSIKQQYILGKLPVIDLDENLKRMKQKISNLLTELESYNRIDAVHEKAFITLEKRKTLIKDRIAKLQKEYIKEELFYRVDKEVKELNFSYSNNQFINGIIVFFSSEGILKSVKTISKYQASIASIFLCLSMLAVQSGQFTENLDEGQLNFNNIEVSNKLKEENKKWENFLLTLPDSTNTQIDSEEDKIIAESAKLIELLIAKSFILNEEEQDIENNYYNNCLLIRHNIIKYYIAGKKGTYSGIRYYNSDIFNNPIKAQNFTDPERDYYKQYENITNEAKNKTKWNKKINEDLNSFLKKSNPLEKEQILGKLKKFVLSFNKQISMHDIVALTYEQAINLGLQGAEGLIKDDNYIIKKIFKKITSKTFQNVYNNTFEFSIRRILHSFLIERNSLEDAIKDMKIGVHDKNILCETMAESQIEINKNIRDFNQLKVELSKAPPTLSAEPNLSEIVLKNKINGIKNITDQGKLLLAECNSIYSDFFPNYVGAQNETIKGKVIRSLNISPSSSEISENIMTSSFNFLNLVGNPRVGGVLIGRDPDDHKQFISSISDLVWIDAGDTILLYLIRTNNEKVSLGSFDKEEIILSLVYAADSRPVSCTMVDLGLPSNRYEPPPLKILLHPALLDTRYGCNIIKLDRFVDSFTMNTEIENLRRICSSQLELYKYCCSYVLKKRKILDDSLLLENFDTFSHEDLTPYKNLFMNNDYSPLFVKKEYFNQEMVNMISKGLNDRNINTVGQLSEYISTNIESINNSGDLLITDPQIWSGVREQAYFLNEDLQFLRNDRVLKFIIQVAFQKSKYCNRENFFPEYDSLPWEFPVLTEGNILEKIMKDSLELPLNRTIMINSNRFVILQRLFRNIFNGKFGFRFPVNRLFDLMETCNNKVVYIKTPDLSRCYSSESEFGVLQSYLTELRYLDNCGDCK